MFGKLCVYKAYHYNPFQRQARDIVRSALKTDGYCDFEAEWVIAVTWYNVSVGSTDTEVHMCKLTYFQ